jgi:hypothetical protein
MASKEPTSGYLFIRPSRGVDNNIKVSLPLQLVNEEPPLTNDDLTASFAASRAKGPAQRQSSYSNTALNF